ncbi:MAG TPA: hypothetical protein VIG56_06505, partial [Pseudolabrys sp.]
MTALKNRLEARLARLRPHALSKRLRKWIERSLVQSPIRWGYRRPLLIGPVARLMERRLCIRYGWDLDLFTGKTTVATSRGGSGAACLRHAYPLLWRQGLKIEALRIAKWARFGNSVIQLRNALQLAEFLDV